MECSSASGSEEAGLLFVSNLAAGLVLLRRPAVAREVAAPLLVEEDAFGDEHALLEVGRDDDAPRRARALRVDDTLPGDALVSRVHDEADGARRVAFAEDFGELPVSHHAPRRYPPHDLEDSLAVAARVNINSFGPTLRVTPLVGHLGAPPVVASEGVIRRARRAGLRRLRRVRVRGAS